MQRASVFAKHILYLASCEEVPELITNLRLQKLLYYVQGWALAMRGEPAFPEPIEAWKHGPVVHCVYKRYQEYGDNPIPFEGAPPNELSTDDRAFVKSIWEGYKQYSAIELVRKSHAELPWLQARKGYDRDDLCKEEISQVTMAEFFRSEFQKAQVNGMDLETAMWMCSPTRPRRGKPLAEVLAKNGLGDAIPPS